MTQFDSKGAPTGADEVVSSADAGAPPPATPQGDGSDASTTSPAPDGTTAAGGVISGDDAQRQIEEHKDRYLRLAAEYDNHRRRSVKERQEAGTRAQAELAKHLIDALDDLARFAHVDPTTVDTATVVEGVEMVEKKLVKALTGAGLELVDPVGEPFDPTRHEAVGTEPAAGRDDDHTVARVYQRGYVFGGQLLRPARVVVKQYNG
jgi:molecular chaperone GrpE